jgi:hypothetical protein
MEVRRKKEGPQLRTPRLFCQRAKRFFWNCQIISDINQRPNTAPRENEINFRPNYSPERFWGCLYNGSEVRL